MIMTWSLHIRKTAGAIRARTGLGCRDAISSDELCLRLSQATGIAIVPRPPGDSLLSGAVSVLDPRMSTIWLDNSLGPAERCAACIHEFGHHFLHCVRSDCNLADVNSTLHAASNIDKVDGYSPRQRIEMDANVFAAEFVLPLTLASDLFLRQGMTASQIASKLNLTMGQVYGQLRDAVLSAGAGSQGGDGQSESTIQLDESQLNAARAPIGPVLVGAGPGTGKTTCLVGRCRYLIEERGVLPQQILVLTFSRKAAQEMRDRLESLKIARGQAAPWIGTFHSFGLEILRRYGCHLGLPDDFSLITPDDCDLLLAGSLAELNLVELSDPEVPARNIAALGNEISRAKAELCTAEQYRAAAQRVPEPDRAKLLEVAHCYDVYNRLLAQMNAIDFSDLIVRSLALLAEHSDVAAKLREDYPHVLADEYQDVDVATARLLKLLAGETAAGLWLVGDERQTIYRFRGASPASVAMFKTDYPHGVRYDLTRNYRSCPRIVDLADAAARALGIGAADTPGPMWRAVREAPGQECIAWACADSEAAQADAIAGYIKGAAAADYSRFAVLCRTHKKAEYIAEHLAAMSVPTLYIGDLLDCEVVNDLLSMMRSMAPCASSPKELLESILFGFNSYARSLVPATNDDPAALAQRLAVGQLLSLAAGFDSRVVRFQGDHASPVDEFIDHLEWKHQSGSGPRGCQPDAMLGVNAVRVMSIHAAKGLEFPIVFVPYVQTYQFPLKSPPSVLPNREEAADAADRALDEEKCLFFVALTRARDQIVLSRVGKGPSGRRIGESKLLASIRPWLTQAAGEEARWG